MAIESAPVLLAWPRTRWVPNLTAFAASGAIMLIELCAGALISSHVGMSLYTWTSIIGVIMAGMAVGNALGGRFADRCRPVRTLAALFFLAALGCAAILPLNTFFGTLPALVGQAWPVRILLHNAGVFLVPALLLGAITPVVAKLALGVHDAQGRTVGVVFAWGVAGSIAGTFLTGYYLVYAFGTREIILTAASVLGALGAYFAVAAVRHAESAPESPRRDANAAWGLRPALLVACVTVLASNALFMTFELAAARVVSRQFGASLYTWTAVIGVMLAGITLGNYLGGRLADRAASRTLLGRLFLLASLAAFTAPLLSREMGGLLTSSVTLSTISWPVQIALYVLVSFLLPCILVGTISPVVVKRLLAEGHAPGGAVGAVYAWGSVGAILGTFATGFFLIDWLWSLPVLGLVTALLAVVAALFAGVRAWCVLGWAGVSVALFACSVSSVAPLGVVAKFVGLRGAQQPHTIYEDESQYSYIAITTSADNPMRREMLLDKLTHSAVDIEHPDELKYEYEWVYEAVMDKVHPDRAPVSVMVIGGGGFAFPHYLEVARPGGYVETSEIDPAVTEAAHAAFGLPRDTTGKIFDMDARNRVDDLLRAKAAGQEVPNFDFILGDSINDYTVPRHLTTQEFAQDVDRLLKDDGMYLLNLIDMLDSGLFVGAVVSTLREVFPVVQVFNTGRPTSVRDTFVVVCSKVPRDLADIPERIRTKHPYVGWQIDLDALLTPARRLLLTDNYAPVDLLLRPVILTRQRDRSQALYYKAYNAAVAGELQRALEYCEEAARLRDRYPELYTLMAKIYEQQGKKIERIEALQRATAGNSEPGPAWLALGNALMEAGDKERAYSALAEAVSFDPENVELLTHLGTRALQDGRPDIALPQWQALAQRTPESVSTQYNLGLAYAGLNRFEEAITAWQKAVAMDPKHLDSYQNLALAYHLSGKTAEKQAVIAKIRELGGTPDPQLEQPVGQ